MNPDELLQAQQLSRYFLTDAKSLAEELPAGAKRDALEARIREAETKLDLAEATAWKALGFKLHDCKSPPARILWNESRHAHICENCGHTRERPKPTDTRVRYNPFGGGRNSWMGS